MTKYWLGKKRSEEDRKKISLALRGRKLTKEHRAKVIKNLVRSPWAGKKLTVEHRLKIGLGNKGKKYKPMSKEGRRNISKAHKGLKLSVKTRKKLSKLNRGEKSHLWKGGITKINTLIRSSLEYRLWRESVFKRDNFACQFCRKRGVALNADHIKPFAYFPELRLELDNGRTLCVPCHEKTDTYKGKAKNYKDICLKLDK